MITCIAQLKNARRGHDAQGSLKSIQLSGTEEGYAEFLPSGRVDRIAEAAKRLPAEQGAAIYTEEVLRPATETYLTPAWDEMVPFPTTWKIRFDGFGGSDYRGADGRPYGLLAGPAVPDDSPPWYQPQGAGREGGVFGESACVCARHKGEKGDGAKGAGVNAAELESTLSTGCGLPHHSGVKDQVGVNGWP